MFHPVPQRRGVGRERGVRQQRSLEVLCRFARKERGKGRPGGQEDPGAAAVAAGDRVGQRRRAAAVLGFNGALGSEQEA